ncbi:hypothetical protein [Caulobacter sp. 17J80-11]|uniref:hypothetical protein n=1 Tax=Caulobacter sp. 17J80-11 TaxID=2763502 RepID=UPI0016538E92|nr:hypothetical protein [Caulobacter sp. 17J80-11]MBC6983135.1 hypothetical protein [Caulobacter sp. 17J80-11]
MKIAAEIPIVWRVALASPPERVFALLDTDEGRQRFWAARSAATADGFVLTFADGREARVEVLERRAPTRLVLRYFGAEVELELDAADPGCVLELRDHGRELLDWRDRHAGWVSWLLTLKAAVDFGVDLRNGAPHRSWDQRFVDP